MADLVIHQNLHQSIIAAAKVSPIQYVWYVCVDYELLKPLQGGPVIIVYLPFITLAFTCTIVIDCKVSKVILFYLMTTITMKSHKQFTD